MFFGRGVRNLVILHMCISCTPPTFRTSYRRSIEAYVETYAAHELHAGAEVLGVPLAVPSGDNNSLSFLFTSGNAPSIKLNPTFEHSYTCSNVLSVSTELMLLLSKPIVSIDLTWSLTLGYIPQGMKERMRTRGDVDLRASSTMSHHLECRNMSQPQVGG